MLLESSSKLFELSKLIDNIGSSGLFQCLSQNRVFTETLAHNIFSIYQHLYLLEDSGFINMEEESVKTLIGTLEFTCSRLILLLENSPKNKRKDDRQISYTFERETSSEIMEIKKYIENIRDCLNKLKFSKDSPYAQADSKDASKKKLPSPSASAVNLKTSSESPLELVAFDIQSSNGIQHPDTICFNTRIFHLFGNEFNCGRAGFLTKTMFHLSSTDEVVNVTGSLGIGKTHFCIHLARALIDELKYNRCFFLKCRANSEFPLTTIEVMQNVIKHWNVGEMPTKREDLVKQYHRTFIGKKTILFLDDPVSAKQVLELIPRIKRNSASKVIVLIASRKDLGLASFTKQNVDVFEGDKITEKKPKEPGHDLDYDTDDFEADYQSDEEEDVDEEIVTELQPEDDTLLDDAAANKKTAIEKEMKEIFGTQKKKSVTVILNPDEEDRAVIKHPKNFYLFSVTLDKLDLDGGVALLKSVNPNIHEDEAKGVSLLAENIPIFLKIASRTHQKWSNMSMSEFTQYISKAIDNTRGKNYTQLKILCLGYFSSCFSKFPEQLQQIILKLTTFTSSFDIFSAAVVLQEKLSLMLRVMAELNKMGLMQFEPYPQRYCFHDLVRETFMQYAESKEDFGEILNQCRTLYLSNYLTLLVEWNREHEFAGIGYMPGVEKYDLDIQNAKTIMDLVKDSEVDHIDTLNKTRYIIKDRNFAIHRGVLYQKLMRFVDNCESDFVKAEFMEGFAYIYYQLTDFSKAYETARKALEIKQNAVILSEVADDELELLSCYKLLGDIASQNRAYDIAKQHYEKLISIATKMAKPWQKIKIDKTKTDNQFAGYEEDEFLIVDYYLAHALTHMAVISLTKENFTEAKNNFDKGITVMKRIYGAAHPELSAAYASYANILKSIKNKPAIYSEMNRYFEEALQIDRALFGENNYVQAQRLDDYAVSLLAQSRYKEAEEIFTKTLQMRIEQYGPEDVAVSSIMNNLAVALKNQNKLHEAEKYYTKSLDIIVKALGQNHYQVSVAKNNLAKLREQMGQTEQAAKLYTEALESVETAPVQGDEDVKVSMLLNIAEAHRAKGEYDQAIAQYEQALEIKKKASKDGEMSDPEVAKIMGGIAKIYFDRGQYQEAEQLQEDAIKIIEKQYGKKNPAYVGMLTTLANTYYRHSKFKEACGKFYEAFQLKLEMKEEPMKLITIIQSLAVCFDMLKDFASAEKYYAELLKLCEANKVADDKMRATLSSYATNLSRQGKYKEALPLYVRALDLVSKQFGEESIEYGDINNNLGAVHLALNDYDEAERAYAVAKVIYEDKLGTDHEKTASLLENLHELRILIYRRDRSKKCCTIN